MRERKYFKGGKCAVHVTYKRKYKKIYIEKYIVKYDIAPVLVLVGKKK
jgi:hypothetical protein